jgi:hypothetical protein
MSGAGGNKVKRLARTDGLRRAPGADIENKLRRFFSQLADHFWAGAVNFRIFSEFPDRRGDFSGGGRSDTDAPQCYTFAASVDSA